MQILSVIKRHGYRLEDVANALGITKGSLSATINGSPNVKKLIEIALVIGCSPAEFFDDWYDNEGKEQQRPAAQQPLAQPSQQPAKESAASTKGGGLYAKFYDEYQHYNAEDSLQGTATPPEKAVSKQGLVCPHCGKAMVISVASEKVKSEE